MGDIEVAIILNYVLYAFNEQATGPRQVETGKCLCRNLWTGLSLRKSRFA